MTVLGTQRYMAGRPPGHHLPINVTLYVIGILLMLVGAVMMVPALVDLAGASTEWHGFVAAGGTSIFVGGMMWLTNRSPDFHLPARRGYLLTALSWVLIGVVSALPYMTGSTHLNFTDAFFESMSGLTTTGSTVIVGLDKLPEGILLWRSLTQWLGGIGIIVMAIVILPFLRIGGMQLFHTESSDRSDKPMSRTSKVVAATAFAYLALSVACAVALYLGGMSPFDAINHAMATLSTGGFSTHDASFGFFQSAAIQWIDVVFMTAGALPLVFFVRLVTQGRRAIREDGQVRWFLAVVAVAIAVMTLWTWLRAGHAVRPRRDAVGLQRDLDHQRHRFRVHRFRRLGHVRRGAVLPVLFPRAAAPARPQAASRPSAGASCWPARACSCVACCSPAACSSRASAGARSRRTSATTCATSSSSMC